MTRKFNLKKVTNNIETSGEKARIVGEVQGSRRVPPNYQSQSSAECDSKKAIIPESKTHQLPTALIRINRTM